MVAKITLFGVTFYFNVLQMLGIVAVVGGIIACCIALLVLRLMEMYRRWKDEKEHPDKRHRRRMK